MSTLSRRNFVKAAPLVAGSIFFPIGKATPLLETEHILLNQGDVVRLEYPDLYIDRFVPPPPDPEPYRFIFVTDIHVGRANTYAPGEPQSIVDHLESLGVDRIICNGDNTDHGTLEEMQAFLAMWNSTPTCLPGNHSEDKLYTDPPPNSYTHYASEIGQWRWAFDVLNFRFIGITSNIKRDAPFLNFGYLHADDKAFLDTERANLGTKIPLLFTHFPVHDYYGNNIRDYQGVGVQSGQKNIFDLFTAAGKGLAFTGHRHCGFLPHTSEVVPGLTELQGSCMAYNTEGRIPAFHLVTLTENHALVEVFRARAPFDKLTEMEFAF